MLRGVWKTVDSARVGHPPEKKKPRPPLREKGAVSSGPNLCLEEVFEGELNHARRIGRRGNLAERERSIQVVSRRIELRMIPYVVELGPELEGAVFPDPSVLHDRCILVVLAGPEYDSHGRVAIARACSFEVGAVGIEGSSAADAAGRIGDRTGQGAGAGAKQKSAAKQNTDAARSEAESRREFILAPRSINFVPTHTQTRGRRYAVIF